MSKVVSQTHITGDKGVAAFHTYCASHEPYVLWRAETSNDFGIDGEIELTSLTSEGKTEVTGEILKVQIKSTLKGSYIDKENETSFEFKPRSQDVDYWNNHKLAVLLVVYDDRNKTLYCKKIKEVDLGLYKKKQPIVFDKKDNLLESGKNDFITQYSHDFKQRVNFNITEEISTNLFKFSSLPKFIYSFESKVNTAKEVFEQITVPGEVPVFVINSKRIFTFYDLGNYKKFSEEIIQYDKKTKEPFKAYLNDLNKRRIAIDLLNQQLKHILYKSHIGFNKQYNRYYFFKDPQGDRKILYDPKSGKRKDTERTVVTFKEYGKYSFYRHNAFEVKYELIGESLYLVLTPQYLFTSDGKAVLEDKKLITKFTNYMTSREFNQQVLNHIHSIYSYLSGRDGKIKLCEIEDSNIQLNIYHKEKVPFGIPLDITSQQKSEETSDTQMTLAL